MMTYYITDGTEVTVMPMGGMGSVGDAVLTSGVLYLSPGLDYYSYGIFWEKDGSEYAVIHYPLDDHRQIALMR